MRAFVSAILALGLRVMVGVMSVGSGWAMKDVAKASRMVTHHEWPPQTLLVAHCTDFNYNNAKALHYVVTTANKIKQCHGLVSEPSTWRANQRPRIMI